MSASMALRLLDAVRCWCVTGAFSILPLLFFTKMDLEVLRFAWDDGLELGNFRLFDNVRARSRRVVLRNKHCISEGKSAA